MLFAHIQYPIIDFRPFLNDEFRRNIPVFPAPSANTWLRNFGHVHERRTDTCPYYIAENFFCEAHNAVKFETLPLIRGKKQEEYRIGRRKFHEEHLIYDKMCIFRRFRSDGNLKSCFEIGLLSNPENDSILLAHQELEELFVNVKSYTKGKDIRVPLFEIGNHICKLYDDSTSIKKTPVKTIYSGSPCLMFIDYDSISDGDNNFISYPEFGKLGIRLKHIKKYYYNNYGDVWIIQPWGYHPDKKLLASIRRALLAILLEKETLLSTYNFLLLNAGKGYINETKVLNYIKKTQEKLLKKIRFGIPQSPIVDILFKIDFENNIAFYSNVIDLISKVEDKYIADDFNKLFIELEFNEWRKKITNLLENFDSCRYQLHKSENSTISDKELRKNLKQLRDICIEGDSRKFWDFFNKRTLKTIILNIISNLLSNGIEKGSELIIKTLGLYFQQPSV